jgi:iron complex outermembrane recepter protein
MWEATTPPCLLAVLHTAGTAVFGKLATFRATVQNVANEAYWASDIGGYLTQGAPRTVVLSIATDF